MSLITRSPNATRPPWTSPDGSDRGVRDVDRRLKHFHDAMEHPSNQGRGTAVTPANPRGGEKTTPLETMTEWATASGAAVARIHCAENETSIAAFVSTLSVGPAPIISPGAAHLLHALNGRRSAQLRFLEALLRRHARHRAVLIVVDDAAALEPDAARLVYQLSGLLHDVAVAWMHAGRLGVPPDAFAQSADTRFGPHGAARGDAPRTASGAHPSRSIGRRSRPRSGPRGQDRPRFGWNALTDTEVWVVRLIVQGHTNRATATALFVSANTISTHLRSIYNKLDVNSRVQLTRMALRHLSEEDRRLPLAAPRHLEANR